MKTKSVFFEFFPFDNSVCILCLVLGLMATCGLAAGLWLAQPHHATPSDTSLPHRIVGGSMADALRGTHYEVDCADCRFKFSCDAEDPPHDQRAVCPNCGYERNPLRNTQKGPGDQVTMNQAANDSQRFPARWDIVAFRTPDNIKSFSVKRIVGLPGEHVAIRRGDIFIDGRIYQKTLDELRPLAILLHDNTYRPSLGGNLMPRWRPESDTSHWRTHGDGFIRIGDASIQELPPDSTTPEDWLVYHHWPCLPSFAPRQTEAPVKENYGYNQGLSRQLHGVTDVMLSCYVKLNRIARVVLRIQDGRDFYHVLLLRTPDRVVLKRGEMNLSKFAANHDIFAQEFLVEVAFCDGRLLVAINRRQVIQHDSPQSDEPRCPTARPLGIGTSGSAVEIRQLRIYRDLHYLDPRGLGRDWTIERPLFEDEYFVLGDNVPISVDSRHWATPGLPRKLLIGKVLAPTR